MCPGYELSTGPETNVANYDKCMKAKYKYATLAEFIRKNQVVEPGATPIDGYTLPDQMASVVINKTLIFGNDLGHHGPCSVMCDEKEVVYELNCHFKFTGKPAVIPIDFDTCSKAKKVWFYWVAMHGAGWQVYTNAFPVKSSSSGNKESTEGSNEYSDPTKTNVNEGTQLDTKNDATPNPDTKPAPETTPPSETKPAPETTPPSETKPAPETTSPPETTPPPETTTKPETATKPETTTKPDTAAKLEEETTSKGAGEVYPAGDKGNEEESTTDNSGGSDSTEKNTNQQETASQKSKCTLRT
ncbi:hypothetical protein ABG067_005267 [Albugo candida]